MMKGLEYLGKASSQQDAYSKLRNMISHKCFFEASTLHSMSACVPWVFIIYGTVSSHYERSEYFMMVLACLMSWAKIQLVSSSIATSFFLRLNQRLMMIEIERVQQDIRDADIDDVKYLGPRIKKLLVECHHICNNSHKFFFLWAPVIGVHLALLLIGVVQASSGRCMPFWVFIAEVQVRPCKWGSDKLRRHIYTGYRLPVSITSFCTLN